MRLRRMLRRWIVTMSILGVLTGQLAYAASPVRIDGRAPQAVNSAGIRDIALQDSGTLFGQLTDSHGAPASQVPVVLTRDGIPVMTSQTDQSGRFALTPVTPGVHELHAPGIRGVYRLWAPRTAPPSAQESILAVTDPSVVLGQAPGMMQTAGNFLANPWVLAGIVALAIGIPLAVDNDNSGGS